MATNLSGMDITGVHIVGSPAIRKKYLIVKSEEDMAMYKAKGGADAEDKTDQGADEDQENADGSKKNMKKSDGSGAEDEAATAQAKLDELTKAASEAEVAKTTAETALKAKDAALMKSALEILKSIESDSAKSAVETLEAQLDGKTVEKSTKSTADEVTKAVKSLLPEITKSIEEPLKKSLDETKVELEEIKKSNALLIGEKVNREVEEIAKSLFGDHEKNVEFIRLMKAKLDDEQFAAVVKREQDKAEQVQKSNLFKEAGSTGWNVSTGDSPYAQLTDIANGMIQKSGDSKLTFNDAFSKACAERPDLYDQYRNASYGNKVRDE